MGFVMGPGLKLLAHPLACSRMMNEHVFAGWLELLFNSSLAVLWSVCTGKGRQGKDCLPGSSWPASSCTALPVETSSVLVHLSVSRSDSPDAPPPQDSQQRVSSQPVLGARGLESLSGPG